MLGICKKVIIKQIRKVLTNCSDAVINCTSSTKFILAQNIRYTTGVSLRNILAKFSSNI